MNTVIAAMAAITAGGLVGVLVEIMVIALIFWLIWWAVGAIGVPQPFAKVIHVVLIVFAVIFLINALLGLEGHAFVAW